MMEIAAPFVTIFILLLLLIFHVLIIFKIIPYKIIWGARIRSEKQMYVLESAAVLLNVFFLGVVLVHAKILKVPTLEIFRAVALWFMTVFFALNTLGNILSQNSLERWIFTPITLVLCISSCIMALNS